MVAIVKRLFAQPDDVRDIAARVDAVLTKIETTHRTALLDAERRSYDRPTWDRRSGFDRRMGDRRNGGSA